MTSTGEGGEWSVTQTPQLILFFFSLPRSRFSAVTQRSVTSQKEAARETYFPYAFAKLVTENLKFSEYK